jgi:hypothetical protein
MKHSGILIRIAALIFSLSVGGSNILFGQPYLARYQWLPGTIQVETKVGHSHRNQRERGLLQSGSVRTLSMSQAAMVLSSQQVNGQPQGTVLLSDYNASQDVVWQGGRPLSSQAGDIYLAATQLDSGQTTGIIAHLSDLLGQIDWVRRWPGVRIHDILLDEDSNLVALGQGTDLNGNPDLRLLKVDPGLPGAVARSWGNSESDGPTRLIDLPGKEDYLMVGWQEIGGNRYPLVASMTGNYDIDWYQAYPLSHRVTEVSDAARLGDRIAITGSALVPNTADTLAFMLLLKETGEMIVCHYFGQTGGQPMLGKAITAVEPAQGGTSGWVIGGAWRETIGDTYARSWLMGTDADGLPKWTRSYFKPAGDLDISQWVNSLHYHPEQNMFLATGPQAAYVQGQWSYTQSLTIKGSPAGGEVQPGTQQCSDRLEITMSNEKVVGFKQGQLWAAPGTQAGSLHLEIASTSAMYCAFPQRQATSIEVPTTAYGPQRVQYLDLQGRLLHQAELHPGQNPVLPDHLPHGIYLMRRFVNGQLVETKKVMGNNF